MIEFDVLITDLDEDREIKVDVAKILGVGYLEVNDTEAKFPVKGIIYGLDSKRCMINLICQHKKHPALNVFYLFDTGKFLVF